MAEWFIIVNLINNKRDACNIFSSGDKIRHENEQYQTKKHERVHAHKVSYKSENKPS